MIVSSAHFHHHASGFALQSHKTIKRTRVSLSARSVSELKLELQAFCSDSYMQYRLIQLTYPVYRNSQPTCDVSAATSPLLLVSLTLLITSTSSVRTQSVSVKIVIITTVTFIAISDTHILVAAGFC